MKQSKEAGERCIRKTYKGKISPRIDDLPVLTEANEILIVLWNKALAECSRRLELPKESRGRSITFFSMSYWLQATRNGDTEHRFSSLNVWLEREVLRRLSGSFSSFFALKKVGDARARPPKEKSAENSFIALTWTGKSFSINGNTFRASLGKDRKVEFTFGEYIARILEKLPAGAEIAQITVTKKEGEFWASFVCNVPRPVPMQTRGIVAIDLGAGDIACSTSTGQEFLIPTRRPDKKWRREIIAVEERVDKCKKHSRAWKRRMKARRIMHKLSLGQHTDHQRKVAHWIAKQNMAIVIGKMKTRLGLAQSVEGTAEEHWGIQNTGYAFRLLLFLKEKAGEYGLTFLEVPDPPREGSLEDPLVKFVATRKMLKEGCLQLNVPYPEHFKMTSFSIPQ